MCEWTYLTLESVVIDPCRTLKVVSRVFVNDCVVHLRLILGKRAVGPSV